MSQISLEQIVAEVEAIHNAIDGKQSLDSAIKGGELLLIAKNSDEVPHGKFQQWIEDNFETVSYRTALRFLSLVEYGELIKDCQTRNEAYKKIAQFRKEQKAEAKPRVTEGGDTDNAEQQIDLATESKNTATAIIRQRVQSELNTRGVNWDVHTWIKQNNRPNSNDGVNRLQTVIDELTMIAGKEFSSALTLREEAVIKVEIILETMLAMIIENTNKVIEMPEAIAA
jgi:hypothetical protein